MVRGIIEALQLHARASPPAPALLDDRLTLSYSETLDRVKHLASLLTAAGVRPGDRVALCAENSIEVVIAMYAVLAAGCAFIPLSVRDPEARLHALCARARPAALLTSRKNLVVEGVLRIDLDEALEVTNGLDRLPAGEAVKAPGGSPEGAQSAIRSSGDALAYVIFTSGSTGGPKGVCVGRQGFAHAVHEAARIMGFGPSTRSLLVLPLHFDGSFSSLFPILSSGGSVYVHRGPICLPSTFLQIVERARITHTTVTPTFLRALVTYDRWSAARCQSLRTLALGGEEPPKAVLRGLREELRSIAFFNRYGPTEAVMAVSTLEILDSMLRTEDPIPIGTPHDGVIFVARNAEGVPIEPGEQGELYIGGRQLMLGYLDDDQATAAVLGDFLGDGQKWLKTGDLVTRDADGLYVFVGRADGLIKRNGTRISLGEIEAALNDLAVVTAAACVKTQAASSIHVFAFVQPANPGVSERDVRRALLQQLPPAMTPDVIQFVNELPRGSGGKIDRQALTMLALDAIRAS